MRGSLGLVLVDFTEVLVRIYGKVESQGWILQYSKTRDLATFQKDPISAAEVANFLLEVSFSRLGISVEEWRIFTRNIVDETGEQLNWLTGLNCEPLTLEREQDLLFKGLIKEFE